jgi:hypothetical protein
MIFTSGTILGAVGWYASERLTGASPLSSHFAYFAMQFFLSAFACAIAYKTLAPFSLLRLTFGYFSGLVVYKAFSTTTADLEGFQIIMRQVTPFCTIPLFLGLATIAGRIIINRYRRKKL